MAISDTYQSDRFEAEMVVRPALDVLELLGVDERLVVVGKFDIVGHMGSTFV